MYIIFFLNGYNLDQETEILAVVCWYDDPPSVFLCEVKLPVIQVHRDHWDKEGRLRNIAKEETHVSHTRNTKILLF